MGGNVLPRCISWGCRDGRVQGVTHFQHVISYDAFGLDQDLMDHGVTMVTVHFVDAVLVKFGQRQQHLQGQSLGLLAVAKLHCLDTTVAEVRDTEEKKVSSRRVCIISQTHNTMSNIFFIKAFFSLLQIEHYTTSVLTRDPPGAHLIFQKHFITS